MLSFSLLHSFFVTFSLSFSLSLPFLSLDLKWFFFHRVPSFAFSVSLYRGIGFLDPFSLFMCCLFIGLSFSWLSNMSICLWKHSFSSLWFFPFALAHSIHLNIKWKCVRNLFSDSNNRQHSAHKRRRRKNMTRATPTTPTSIWSRKKHLDRSNNEKRKMQKWTLKSYFYSSSFFSRSSNIITSSFRVVIISARFAWMNNRWWRMVKIL